MAETKIQGTLKVEGMVQGRFDGSDASQEALRQWVEQAASQGLRFHLEIEGATFNVLADNSPLPVAVLGAPPQPAIAAALDALVQAVPPPFRNQTLSTVRSVEYQPSCEIQTLYVLGPDGKMQYRDRTVNAHTVAPPTPLTLRDKIKMAATSLGVLLVLLAISSLFVDYRALVTDIIRQASPFKPEKVEVKYDDFRDFFTLTARTKSTDGKAILLTIERTKDYPRTDAQLDALLSQVQEAQALQAKLVMAGAVLDALLGSTTRPASGPEHAGASSLPTSSSSSSAPATTKPVSLTRIRLALEALAQGYVRCECFDADGAFLGSVFCRIVELRTKPTTVLSIPLPSGKDLAQIVITF